MSWIMAATVGGGMILNYMGAQGSADAMQSAGQNQMNASMYAANLQNQQYQQNRTDMQPWRQAGQGALMSLQDLMGTEQAPTDFGTMPTAPDRSQFMTAGGQYMDPSYGGIPQLGGQFNQAAYDQAMQQYNTQLSGYNANKANAMSAYTARTQAPGYGSLMKPFQYDPKQDPSTQFRFQEGLTAQNQNEALQGYFRGQTGVDLQNYGQNFASTEYNNAYNRDASQRTNIYNMLAGLSGTGQAATQQTGQFGMQAATNAGQFGIQGAQAQGQGQVGAAQAYAGMYNNMGNQMMGGLGTYMNYNMLNNYLNNGIYNQAAAQYGGGLSDTMLP